MRRRRQSGGTGGAVTGGAGIDTLLVNLSMASDQVMFGGANGPGIIGYQTPRQQHLFFHDIERIELTTGSGDDLVQGSALDDKISTGAGADFIGWSWPDPDSEASSAGDDIVDAGAGDDTIVDPQGANHLFGGDGNDNITTRRSLRPRSMAAPAMTRCGSTKADGPKTSPSILSLATRQRARLCAELSKPTS